MNQGVLRDKCENYVNQLKEQLNKVLIRQKIIKSNKQGSSSQSYINHSIMVSIDDKLNITTELFNDGNEMCKRIEELSLQISHSIQSIVNSHP